MLAMCRFYFSRLLKIYFVYLIFSIALIDALKLDRAIIACDANPKYLEFWPIVARAWSKIIGIRPTLILVADDSVQVDETLGDVYRFRPTPHIPTWFQAQNLRLLFPVKFPNEICIISDMDMLPLARAFFVDTIVHIPANGVAIYCNGAYDKTTPKFPMCYIAAKGSVFGEIFKVATDQDIKDKLQEWFDFEPGWDTDELALYSYLIKWPYFAERCFKLGFGGDSSKCLDRSNWHYDQAKLLRGEYYQAHLPRPYSLHKSEIDKLVELLKLDKNN